ncbi:hypothetical protein pb186bvf_014484 [Paramecium bursaria]
MNYKYLFKFIVIGDPSVGKSCLTLQFTEGKYNKKHETTIGVEFGVKEIYIQEQPIKISIWDTAGQESFRSLVRSYYRSAIGVLLVYDMTNKQSFHNLQKWLEEIRENGNENVVIAVVCNKIDLENERQVSQEEGIQFADENGFVYYETSALEGTGVSDTFRKTAQIIYDQIQKDVIKLGKHQLGVLAGTLHKPITYNKQQSQKTDCC